MNEQEAISLVMAFKEDLLGIRSNVQEIKEIVKSNFEFQKENAIQLQPEIDLNDLEGISEPEPELIETVAMTQAADEHDELMKMEYMQTVLGIIITAVLMLSLGVQLFQTFNKHWR